MVSNYCGFRDLKERRTMVLEVTTGSRLFPRRKQLFSRRRDARREEDHSPPSYHARHMAVPTCILHTGAFRRTAPKGEDRGSRGTKNLQITGKVEKRGETVMHVEDEQNCTQPA